MIFVKNPFISSLLTLLLGTGVDSVQDGGYVSVSPVQLADSRADVVLDGLIGLKNDNGQRKR